MRKIIPFTMVELILALGVCAIGICSIMVLIPVGANATRDAALETYAASAAEQLLHFLEYSATLSAQDWNDTIGESGDAPITGGKPEEQDLEFTIADLNNPDIWGGTIADNVYQGKENQQVYLIISHRNDESIPLGDESFPEKIDFRAILAVWKEQISVNSNPIPYGTGARLNVEVSWPAELPYDARQKSLYCLTVFNPNYKASE